MSMSVTSPQPSKCLTWLPGDAKARTLIDLSRALIEVGNIEDHTSARKSLMSEFQAETNEGEAEAATG